VSGPVDKGQRQSNTESRGGSCCQFSHIRFRL
jgi:hypothetical protein